MEEDSVKLYLAEGVPFTLQVTTAPEPGGLVVTASSPDITWMVINPPRCVITGGNPNGMRRKQLSDNLRLAFPSRQFTCGLNLLSRKNNGNPGTEFRVTLTGLELGSRLKRILGEETAFIQAEVVDWKQSSRFSNGRPYYDDFYYSYPAAQIAFKTREMTLPPTTEGTPLVFVDDTYNPALKNLMPVVNSRNTGGGTFPQQTFTAKLNLILIARDCGPTEQHKMAVYQRMLEEEIASDLVIVPRNGAEVKCHRSMLATQSDVFRTMLATDMQEAKTRKIVMPDMSEEGVRALLAYLYHWDTSKAEKSFAVAVEVLKAAHKYNIRFLEKAMRKLMVSKDDHWYEVDAAMKLFLFVHNMDAEWEPLKKMAVLVMKMYSPDLKHSATVQQLFRENPDAAITFCQYAITN